MSGHGPTKGAKYLMQGRPSKARIVQVPRGAVCCGTCGARLIYKDYLASIVLYCPNQPHKEAA